MKHLSIIFIFITAFCTNDLYGQANFKSGHIITNDNKTISGLIDLRGAVNNSRLCVFKESPDSKSVKYKPGSILAYRFTEGQYYVSKKVSLKNNTETEVFLEYLVDGIADLYYLRTSTKEYYWIEKEQGKLINLSNDEKDVYNDGKRYRVVSREYVKVLKELMNESVEIHSEIDQTGLDYGPLIALAKNYHNKVCTDGTQCIVYQKPILKNVIRLALTMQGNSSFLTFPQPSQYTNIYPTSFSRSFYPLAGIHLNSTIPRINENIFVELNAEMGKLKFNSLDQSYDINGTLEYIDVKLNSIFIKTLASIGYNFPGAATPYIKLGIGLQKLINPDLTISRKSTLTSSYTSSIQNNSAVQKWFLLYALELGINFNLENHKLSAAMEYSNSAHDYLGKPVKLRTLGFKIGRYF